jgi:uncharacterized delta-60 repeat protein
VPGRTTNRLPWQMPWRHGNGSSVQPVTASGPEHRGARGCQDEADHAARHDVARIVEAEDDPGRHDQHRERDEEPGERRHVLECHGREAGRRQPCVQGAPTRIPLTAPDVASYSCTVRTFAASGLAAVLSAASVGAGTGDLDATFGTGGVVAGTPFPGGGSLGASAVLVQPDGKLVVVGASNGPFNGNGFAIARYLDDGTLDPTFGTGGMATRFFPADTGIQPSAVLQADGKIVASTCVLVGNDDSYVARFEASGAADLSFGSFGAVAVPDVRSCQNGSLVLQPDGKIVVGGGVIEFGFDADVAVARLNANGSLDATFGTGGVVRDDVASSGTFFGDGGEVVLQPDGNLLVAVFDKLVRYDANGARDPSFGTDGVVTVCTGCTIRGLALHADGRIVAVTASDDDIVLRRFDTAGAADPSFGAGGVVRLDSDVHVDDAEHPFGVLIEPDERIVAVAISGRDAFEEGDFAVVRFEPDGTLDHRFGAGGIVLTHFGPLDGAFAVAGLADGRLVVAGDAGVGSANRFGVARYEGACPSFPDADGDGIGDACDPCTSPGTIDRVTLRLTRVDQPPGFQRVKAKGLLALSPTPPLSTDADGVRLVVTTAAGYVVADVPVLGTRDDAESHAVWISDPSGTAFVYKPRVAFVRPRGRIVRAKVKTLPDGRIKFSVLEKDSTIAIAPGDLPLVMTMVLDARRSETGACGEVAFTAPACTFSNTGTTLICR